MWRVTVIVVVAFIAAVLGHWSADRSLPISVTGVRVINPVVHPGGELRIEFQVTRFRTDCGIVVSRLIFDKARARYVMMDRVFPAAPGPAGADSYIVPVPIPLGIAHGRAVYRSLTAYSCNLIHQFWPLVAPAVDVEFTVTADDQQGRIDADPRTEIDI